MRLTSEAPPRGYDLPLRPGEAVIRSDLVFFKATSTIRRWPYPGEGQRGSLDGRAAQMVLTNQRIRFTSPGLGRVDTYRGWLSYVPFLGLLVWGPFMPLRKSVGFELAEIEKFWDWNPPNSGAPIFQIGFEAWSIQLLNRVPGWSFAPAEQTKAHYDAVVAAWQAVKAS